MNISFNTPVKDHWIHYPTAPTPFQIHDNFDVVKGRTEKYHKGDYDVICGSVIANHRYSDGKIFYKTPRIDTEYGFTFNVDESILPFIEIHVFEFYEKELLLNGPVEIHFSGPEEFGILLKLSY